MLVDWIPIIGVIGTFASIIFFVHASHKSKQARIAAYAAVQTRMIDKFGSAEDFVAFLRTPEGRRFLEAPERQADRGTERILSTISWGVTLTVFGAGLSIPMMALEEGFLVPATMTLSLGLGLLISGLVSRKLSRAWEADRAAAAA